jgi:hypothetical protein
MRPARDPLVAIASSTGEAVFCSADSLVEVCIGSFVIWSTRHQLSSHVFRKPESLKIEQARDLRTEVDRGPGSRVRWRFSQQLLSIDLIYLSEIETRKRAFAGR